MARMTSGSVNSAWPDAFSNSAMDGLLIGAQWLFKIFLKALYPNAHKKKPCPS